MTDKEKELQAEAIDYLRKRIAELEMTVGTLRSFSNEQATCIERLKGNLLSSEEYGKEGLQSYLKLEKENKELKAQIEEMKCWHKMDYNDKESCKKIPRCVQLLTEYDCGLFVAYCVNRWTGDHWEEHNYGIIRWKEIE